MIRTTIRGIRIATILLIGYWLILFAATHIPRVPMPNVEHSDKVIHLAAYSVLSFLLAWAIPTRQKYPWAHVIWAFLLAMTYGAIDEFTQIPVGRTADVYDWIADTTGALIGVVVYSIARKVLIRLYRSQPTPPPMTLSTPPV